MEYQLLRFYKSRSEALADVVEFEEKLDTATEPEEKTIFYGILAQAHRELLNSEKAIDYVNKAQQEAELVAEPSRYVYTWKGLMALITAVIPEYQEQVGHQLLETYQFSRNCETKEIQYFWWMSYAVI